jgi:hypothetical protein
LVLGDLLRLLSLLARLSSSTERYSAVGLESRIHAAGTLDSLNSSANKDSCMRRSARRCCSM